MQFHSIAYDFFRPEHQARVRDAELAAAVRSAVHTNAAPRLPVTRVFELRSVLDRIMVALYSGDIAPTGGFGHEEAEAPDKCLFSLSEGGSANRSRF